jgi:hypothetical protein
VPLIVYCHGNGGYVRRTEDGSGETDWTKLPAGEANKRLFVDSLVGAGFAVAASDAYGMHAWGNPQSVGATAALLSCVLEGANVDATRVGLWGGGAGGAVAWSSALGPLMGKVRAVAMQQSCLSYESVIRHGKFKDVLLEGGYGMPADTPDDNAVEALKHNDPLYRTSLLIAELGDAAAAAALPPAFFLHGDADENILFDENPVALGKVLESCGAAHTFHTPAGVGHNVYGLPHARLLTVDIPSPLSYLLSAAP